MTKDIKEIEMKNISVHIKKGEKTTFTFKKPIATYGTRIAAKEVTVFWNFKNITTTIGNNTFIRKKVRKRRYRRDENYKRWVLRF